MAANNVFRGIAAWRDSAANEKSAGSQTRYLIATARIAKEMARGSAALAEIRTAWPKKTSNRPRRIKRTASHPLEGVRDPALLWSRSSRSQRRAATEVMICMRVATKPLHLIPTQERRKSRDFGPVRAADSHVVFRLPKTPEHSTPRPRPEVEIDRLGGKLVR
jgi:hypothetical protein